MEYLGVHAIESVLRMQLMWTSYNMLLVGCALELWDTVFLMLHSPSNMWNLSP
jgi:hypothetical protein